MAAEDRMNIAAVLLSGGLDSMVAAALAQEAGHEVHALTIDYGQRHKREIEAARAIAKALGLASHSEIAGRAFAIAGVPHVIAIKVDDKVE